MERHHFNLSLTCLIKLVLEMVAKPWKLNYLRGEWGGRGGEWLTVGWFVLAVSTVLLLKRKKKLLVESVTLVCSSDQFNLLPFGLIEIQNGSINQSSSTRNTKSRPRGVPRGALHNQTRKPTDLSHICFFSSNVFKGFWISLTPVKASSLFNG